VVERVDLRPLLADRDAAQMLQLARGQLNAAFRKHGLFPPDPLPVGEHAPLDLDDLDDPAAKGPAYADANYPDAFAVWSTDMPQTLVAPVLGILKQALGALQDREPVDSSAIAAVLRAHDYLLASLRAGPGGQTDLPADRRFRARLAPRRGPWRGGIDARKRRAAPQPRTRR
jgi:hypothetical protein